jgi:hypothetical protein
MNKLALVLSALLSVGLFACSSADGGGEDDKEQDDDDDTTSGSGSSSGKPGFTSGAGSTSGGATSGGATSGGATSGGSTSGGPSGGATSGGSTSGGGSCDQGSCDTCAECALGAACSATAAACGNEPECFALNDCLGQCGDEACSNACFEQYPNGAQPLIDLLSCVICMECTVTCDAASQCGG